jgi:hypothetical protein
LLIVGPPILIAVFTGCGVFDPAAWNYRGTMKAKNRYITPKALHAILQKTPGTLLIDHPSPGMGLFYVWWTPDDVLALAPTPPPGEGYYFNESNFRSLHPFDDWLWKNYLSPDTGTALKVAIWNLHIKQSKLQSRFPSCKILRTWTGVRHVVRCHQEA